MNEIVEKYEAKLFNFNQAYELKKKTLNKTDLEILSMIKILLTEVVTDLRAIRAFSK